MNRRSLFQTVLTSAAAMPAAATLASRATNGTESLAPLGYSPNRYSVVARDGTRLFVRDTGSGPTVLFLSAWTFNSDMWGFHMTKLASEGYRCVAYDRRGHGRSDDPGYGYDADTLADDVAATIDGLGLEDITIVAYSMGGMEAVRYLARHGVDRLSRLILVAPFTPYLTQSQDNPSGIPLTVLEDVRATMMENFPRWIADNEPPFFMADTDPETRAWLREMMRSVSVSTAIACHRTLTGTDVRLDLKAISNRPFLIIQGDQDASAPLPLTGQATLAMLPALTSRLIVYDGAPHGLPFTHAGKLLQDIRSRLPG